MFTAIIVFLILCFLAGILSEAIKTHFSSKRNSQIASCKENEITILNEFKPNLCDSNYNKISDFNHSVNTKDEIQSIEQDDSKKIICETEERIQLNPKFRETYITTIFLWVTQKCHTFEEANTETFYPTYLKYDYEVSSPVEFYNRLFSNGYYTLAEAKDILQNYKVSDLKIILDSVGENKSGNKEQLIQRITQKVPPKELEKYNNSELYTLSAKGQAYITKYKDFIFFHKKRNKWSISLKEYEITMQQLGSGYNFKDIVWSIFNDRIRSSYTKRNFLDIIYTYKCMSELIFEYDKNQKEGTFYLLVSFYCNISGIDYFYSIEQFQKKYITKSSLEHMKCHIFINDQIVKQIRDNVDFFDQNTLKQVTEFVNLPIQLCSQSDFFDIIDEIKNVSPFNNQKWEAHFHTKYKEYVSSLT